MLDRPLEHSDYCSLSSLFAILSNPIRLRILDYLLTECCKRTEGCCSVSEIYLELNLPQPLISKHLKILKENQILDYTRKGNRILYYFGDNTDLKLVFGWISRLNAMQTGNCRQ